MTRTFSIGLTPRQVTRMTPGGRARSLWPRTLRPLRPAALAGALACLGWLAPLAPPPAFADPPKQLTQDQAALQVLDSARRAFNEHNYPVAVTRFKEFLGANGGHREAPSAWFGLGMSLLEGSRDYPAAVDALQRAANAGDFPDKPLALYYLGAAHRGLGEKESAGADAAAAAAKTGEADTHRKAAAQKFEEAAKQFGAARDAFAAAAKANAGKPNAGNQAGARPDAEWSARARADQGEMLLRAGKYAEAAEASTPFQSDPALAKSSYRALGLYHLGYAQFTQKQYLPAGRTLSQLAPFNQPFGPHVRYLLARVHHLADEHPEAVNQYAAVIADYEKQKKAAEQTLQNGNDPANKDPERKAALEALARGPVPDYVARARFYWAELLCEDGHYPEAAERFTAFLQQQPKSPMAAPLVNEAKLRLGYCQLQNRKLNEATAALQPLKDDPVLGDRAQWWLARAQIAAADSGNAGAVAQALNSATDLMRRAADAAGKRAAANPPDPEARARRGDILLDLADAQQLARQYKEAAATCQQVLSENLVPDRAEEAKQRRVTALNLAGQYRESDDAAAAFERDHPRSPWLPAVLFRSGENQYLLALAASEGKAKPDAEATKLFEAAIARYQRLLDKYPEFESNDLARQGVAVSLYKLGKYDQAEEVLEHVPEANRTGELATVPYLQADCLLRTLPPDVDDALQAERLIQTATDAAKLLETFVSAQPKSPQAPDAWLKLGYCYQRIGSVLADPAKRTETLIKAKEAYDKETQTFANDPAAKEINVSVVFERGRCLALMGNADAAANELRRFQSAPFDNSASAPLALLRLGAVLRSQGKAAEAADVLGKACQRYEGALSQDPARAGWVAGMKYEQALALKEANKRPEARAVLESVARQFTGKPEAMNAVWRLAQIRREDVSEQLAAARKVAQSGGTPQQVSAAQAQINDNLNALRQSAGALLAGADSLAKGAPTGEPFLRTLYESAWCYRVVGDAEADAAREVLRQQAAEKVRSNRAKAQPSDPLPPLAGPDVAPGAVPVQAGEEQARRCYRRLIDAAPPAGPSAALAAQARFELAELFARHGEDDAALELLAQALEGQPTPELTDRIKLRVAACLLARNDPKNALAQARAVLVRAKGEKHLIAAQARYLVGEALLARQDAAKAIETLTPFRDDGAFQNLPDVTDRALLRLGNAYAQAGQWDPSRQSLEMLVNRFPQSPWIDEARYGMGWALQNQKRYDEAVNAYTDLTRRTASEAAARAQLNIGLCRLEQKRNDEALKALDAVAYTYDYPEWTAAALFAAGKAHADQNHPPDAARYWRRVVNECPKTQWAERAQKRLDEMK